MNDEMMKSKRIAVLTKQGLPEKERLFDYLADNFEKDEVQFATLHVNIYDSFSKDNRDLVGIKTNDESFDEVRSLAEIAGRQM